MMLFGETVISLLLMFICLVMDVVCLSILSFMYQVLPRPYIGSFDGFLGDKLIKKGVLDLVSQSEIFVWEYFEISITIDDIEK